MYLRAKSEIWVFFCKVVTKKMMWENADQVICGTYLVFCGLKHWSKGISNPNFKSCMSYTNVNSTIWKNEASQNLAVLKPEHIDNYLNYLCAFSTDYMWYFVSNCNHNFWACKDVIKSICEARASSSYIYWKALIQNETALKHSFKWRIWMYWGNSDCMSHHKKLIIIL